MKKLLTFLLVVLGLIAMVLPMFGQTIQSTPATPHTLGTPTHTPSTYGSHLAFDKTNSILYQWLSGAWVRAKAVPTDGDKGDVTVSSTGTNWQLDAASVGTTELASNAADSSKVLDGGLSPNDLAQRGASVGDALTYTSNGWRAKALTGVGGIYGGSGVVPSGTVAYVASELVFDGGGGFPGLAYGGDFSGFYTDRSLPDKGYVDAAISTANATNANLTGPVTSVGNATTITANSIDSTHISNGTISPNDFAQRGASVGQVMTYTSNGWRPAVASALSDGDKGDITVSGSGATWGIDADAVGASEIATNAVDASELVATAVAAGSYTYANFTVDADGRLTAASSGTAPVVNDGNSLGAAMTIGTNDGNLLNLETNGSTRLNVTSGGLVFVGGATTPTARLHIAAGTASANTSPLKLTSGTSLTTPEAGAVEFDGTNYFVTSSSTRYTLAKTLSATATLDFPSISAEGSSNLTITVTGAATGDVTLIGIPSGSIPSNFSYFAWVSAADTVTVRAVNNAVSSTDPASGTFRATVLKY